MTILETFVAYFEITFPAGTENIHESRSYPKGRIYSLYLIRLQ